MAQGLAWVSTYFPEGSGDFQGKHVASLQEATYKLAFIFIYSSLKIYTLEFLQLWI